MPVTTGFRRRTFGGRAPPRRMFGCRKALGVWKRLQPSADARPVSDRADTGPEHLAEIVEKVPPARLGRAGSATCAASGAPSEIARACSVERSRPGPLPAPTTSTPGWSRSHAATAVDVRSGSRSTGRRVSKSIRIVPRDRPFRHATAAVGGGSSMPSTRGVSAHTRRLRSRHRLPVDESQNGVRARRHPQVTE